MLNQDYPFFGQTGVLKKLTKWRWTFYAGCYRLCLNKFKYENVSCYLQGCLFIGRYLLPPDVKSIVSYSSRSAIEDAIIAALSAVWRCRPHHRTQVMVKACRRRDGSQMNAWETFWNITRLWRFFEKRRRKILLAIAADWRRGTAVRGDHFEEFVEWWLVVFDNTNTVVCRRSKQVCVDLGLDLHSGIHSRLKIGMQITAENFFTGTLLMQQIIKSGDSALNSITFWTRFQWDSRNNSPGLFGVELYHCWKDMRIMCNWSSKSRHVSPTFTNG